jgi:bifunctional UDP-N-acetylglucosamine pyrophosphorylase/glucosamine-1-phosphate N-acetyltransferase
VSIADDAVIHPFTHIDGEKAGVEVGQGALIGPFARLRPGAKLGREVHIGNFVEVKNSTWPMAPRPTTWPIWATPRWASA